MTAILLIAPSWVGDTVMAQSLVALLHQEYPDACIDALAPEWCVTVLQCFPGIRRAIPLSITHGEFKLKERYRIGRSLRRENYQLAVVLPNSFKSALIPFFANIPQRRGWLGEARWGLLNDVRRLDKQRYPKMVQRFAALAFDKQKSWDVDTIPPPELNVDTTVLATALSTHQLNTQKPVLALAPGAAFGEAKRWPATHYANVARYYLQRGWQVWLFGSAKDAESTANIQHQCQHACIDLAGKLALFETVALLSKATAVVSNDSGLVHIAAALARPLVAIYGSTSPEFTPPLHPDAVILARDDLPCRPCFKRQCIYGHLACLTEIKPQRVITAIDQLCGESVCAS